jgi:hypothetical protein
MSIPVRVYTAGQPLAHPFQDFEPLSNYLRGPGGLSTLLHSCPTRSPPFGLPNTTCAGQQRVTAWPCVCSDLVSSGRGGVIVVTCLTFPIWELLPGLVFLLIRGPLSGCYCCWSCSATAFAPPKHVKKSDGLVRLLSPALTGRRASMKPTLHVSSIAGADWSSLSNFRKRPIFSHSTRHTSRESRA